MDKSEYTENIKKKLDYSYWNFLCALKKYREVSSFPIEKIENSAKYRKMQKSLPSLKDFSFASPSPFKTKWFMTLEPSLDWLKEGRDRGFFLDGRRPLLNDWYTFAVKAPPSANFATSDIMLDSNVAMNYNGKNGNFYVLDSSDQYQHMLAFLQIFSLYYAVHLRYKRGQRLDPKKDIENFNKFCRLCLKYQLQSSAYEYLAYSICPLIENISRLCDLQGKKFFNEKIDTISDKHQKILWQIEKLRDKHFAHCEMHCVRQKKNFEDISLLLEHDDINEKFLKELIYLKIVPPQEINTKLDNKKLNNELIFSHLISEAQNLLGIKNQEEYLSEAAKKYPSLVDDKVFLLESETLTHRTIDSYVRLALQKIQYFQETLKGYGIKRKGFEKVLKDYGFPKDVVEYYKKFPFFWRNESLHGRLTAQEIMNIDKDQQPEETSFNTVNLENIYKIDALLEVIDDFEKMHYLYPQLKKMDATERNATLLKILSAKKKYEKMKILEEFHSHCDKNGIPRLTALKFKDVSLPLMAEKSTLKKLLSNSIKQINDSSQIASNLKIQKDQIKSH